MLSVAVAFSHPEELTRTPDKPPPDLSRFLISPTLCLLAEMAVTAGPEVRAGNPSWSSRP
jgi:hypothetical protein